MRGIGQLRLFFVLRLVKNFYFRAFTFYVPKQSTFRLDYVHMLKELSYNTTYIVCVLRKCWNLYQWTHAIYRFCCLSSLKCSKHPNRRNFWSKLSSFRVVWLWSASWSASGGSRGGSGGSLGPPPRHPLFNILWKWNNLVSVRQNYFICKEYLRKLR